MATKLTTEDWIAELKEKIRTRLLEQDKKRIKRELESQVVKELIKRNPFAIAPALAYRSFGDACSARVTTPSSAGESSGRC